MRAALPHTEDLLIGTGSICIMKFTGMAIIQSCLSPRGRLLIRGGTKLKFHTLQIISAVLLGIRAAMASRIVRRTQMTMARATMWLILWR